MIFIVLVMCCSCMCLTMNGIYPWWKKWDCPFVLLHAQIFQTLLNEETLYLKPSS